MKQRRFRPKRFKRKYKPKRRGRGSARPVRIGYRW